MTGLLSRPLGLTAVLLSEKARETWSIDSRNGSQSLRIFSTRVYVRYGKLRLPVPTVNVKERVARLPRRRRYLVSNQLQTIQRTTRLSGAKRNQHRRRRLGNPFSSHARAIGHLGSRIRREIQAEHRVQEDASRKDGCRISESQCT